MTSRSSLTIYSPADGSSFDQHALLVSVQVVSQVLLFLRLSAEFQINVVGKLGEIAKTFFSTPHTVSREACQSVDEMNDQHHSRHK